MDKIKKLEREIELQEKTLATEAWTYYLLSGFLFSVIVGGLTYWVIHYDQPGERTLGDIALWFGLYFIGGVLLGLWQRWMNGRRLERLRQELSEVQSDD